MWKILIWEQAHQQQNSLTIVQGNLHSWDVCLWDVVGISICDTNVGENVNGWTVFSKDGVALISWAIQEEDRWIVVNSHHLDIHNRRATQTWAGLARQTEQLTWHTTRNSLKEWTQATVDRQRRARWRKETPICKCNARLKCNVPGRHYSVRKRNLLRGVARRDIYRKDLQCPLHTSSRHVPVHAQCATDAYLYHTSKIITGEGRGGGGRGCGSPVG